MTDSSYQRNKLFYYRHGLWRIITQTAVNSIQGKMFIRMEPVRKCFYFPLIHWRNWHPLVLYSDIIPLFFYPALFVLNRRKFRCATAFILKSGSFQRQPTFGLLSTLVGRRPDWYVWLCSFDFLVRLHSIRSGGVSINLGFFGSIYAM